MNKLESQPTSLTLSPASLPAPEPASWLIVLVSYFEADLTLAARRICELANAGDKRIRFIGLYEDAAQELTLRRQLAHLSALVSTARIYTETESIFREDPVEVIRSRFQDGDMVVCFAASRTGRSSLGDVLSAELNLPVYILSNPAPQKLIGSYWLTQMTAWGGSVAIIAGFFLLQVRIDQMKPDAFHLIVLLASVGLEFWMIRVWNILFK